MNNTKKWSRIYAAMKNKAMLLQLFAGLISICLFTENVTAEQKENPKDSANLIQMELFQEGKFPAPEVVLASEELSEETEKDFKEYVHKSFLRFEKQIPVEQYGLSKNNVRRLMQDLINNNPELFIVSGECSVTLAGDIVQNVEPVYAASSDDLTAYTVEVERILGLVNKSWSDLEKLLFIHDYMASNYEYDYTKTRYSAQELLLEHKGVCNAFMLAYTALVSELGITVRNNVPDVPGEQHAWNTVWLNGRWYNVDVTWDLDVGANTFMVKHRYFLLSDELMLERHNGNYGSSGYCTDTKYNDYYWQDIYAPFVWNDGKWYVLVEDYYVWINNDWELYYNSVYECTPSTGIGKSVFDIKTSFRNYRNLGSFGNKLYYLSDNGISSYDVKTAKSSIEYLNSNSPYQYFVIDGFNLNYKLENGNTGKFVFKENDVVVKTFKDFEYCISPYHKTIVLLNYKGNAKNVVIPDTIEGYKVQRIADSLFEDHEEIESITIPDSVTSIGNSAFSGCSSLTEITIPDSVTFIEERAFYGCSSLTEITIPDQVTFIGWGLFVNCSKLNSITIGKNVDYIDEYAFWGCSHLTSVYYRGDMPDVRDNNIYGDTPNTLISYCPWENASWKTAIQNGQWQGREITDWELVIKTFNNFEYLLSPYHKTVTLLNYTGNVKNVVIPNTIEGYKIQKISASLFEGHEEIESITIPNSVNYIGGSAFKGCSRLKSIVIPPNVTSIGESLFEECSSLESITIPDNVTSIEDRAFWSCGSLTEITIPGQVTHIGWGGFVNCHYLESVTIGKNVDYIDDYAFWGCSRLSSVYYKGNVPDVGKTIYVYTPETLISYYPRENALWKAAIKNGKWQDRGTAEWDAPVPPKVSYKRKNNAVTLTFTGTLQESTDCKKWTTVSGAQGTYTVNTGKNKKFYRCVQ